MSSMSFEDKVWYQKLGYKNILTVVPLLPFTALFGAVSSVRRICYRRGIFSKTKLKVPVIVVGGISVGGTGKTPLCIALLLKLRELGYRPGLISRGYRGKADSYPFTVNVTTDVRLCGDEPLLIKMSVGDSAVVAVDPVRERGAEYLEHFGCDVIVTDDGLQHYSLDRDIEIIVLDGRRMLGNGLLLPAGPLREGKWHLDKADFVVVNGISHDLKYTSMTLVPKPVVSLKTFSGIEHEMDFLQKGCSVCALAGIGNPNRFYDTLKQCGFQVADTISAGDHHKVQTEVLRAYAKNYPVVMTSKDAVKYAHLSLENMYVLNIEAVLPKSFYVSLNEKIKSLDK